MRVDRERRAVLTVSRYNIAMDRAHFDKIQTNTVVRKHLAKLMSRDCFRDTKLEDLHAGINQ